MAGLGIGKKCGSESTPQILTMTSILIIVTVHFYQFCGSEIIFSDPDPALALISGPDSDPGCL
jgi:hypothetical protein